MKGDVGVVARGVGREVTLDKRYLRAEWIGRVVLYCGVVILSLLFALPLLWMVSTSLKTDPQVYHVPPIWIPNPVRFRNYYEVLHDRPFDVYFINTIRYAVLAVVGVTVSSSLVAYAFSKVQWWGRDALFFVALATMMIPFQVTMIPLYITFKNLGWLNSYKPLTIPMFFGNAYYIFLLRQFFLTIPQDLSDAARVDGCSHLRIFVNIVLPLSKQVLTVVALFQFMGAWNNYLGPLIYLNREELFPLALGLRQLRASFQEELLWPHMMAASTAVIAPVIVIFYVAQGLLIEGITLTGIKG